MNALLEDERGGQKHKITPVGAAVVKKAVAGGSNAPAARKMLLEHYKATGQHGRAAPTLRSVQHHLKELAYYARSPHKIMVRTPWHARWRLQYAKHYLMKENLVPIEQILFTDEKKFCLFDSNFGQWIFYEDEEDYNVAKAQNMTDEEYRMWRKEKKEKCLPHSKQRGQHPVFVWGGVGLNMKTSLYIFDTDGKNVTGKDYINVLTNVLVPFKQKQQHDKRKREQGLWITQDNDPKHYKETTKKIQEDNGIHLLGIQRRSANGEVDVAAGRGGHWAPQGIAFPAYSPDINGAIEKVWRELQVRVLKRASEIRSRATMIKVIGEEWAGLPFETEEGSNFIGINGLVRKYEEVLQAVVEENGWDTRFMK